MTPIIYGDLVTLADEGYFDVVVNPANCFHKMGAGFAKAVREKWPEAYEADLKTVRGDRAKLGNFSFVQLPSGLIIVNAYTQYRYSWTEDVVDYEAIMQVFKRIGATFTGKRIAYPMVGAGLARGDWSRIKMLIESALRGEHHTLVRLPHPITRVVSGGQTGADLGGLLAAEKVAIPTGGIAPKGFRTEKGKRPILGTRFGLIEHEDWQYDKRTELNVEYSDMTLILATLPKSKGTLLTVRFCKKHKKPYVIINPFTDDIDLALTELKRYKPETLNIAGNRESVSEGLTLKSRDWLVGLFNRYK